MSAFFNGNEVFTSVLVMGDGSSLNLYLRASGGYLQYSTNNATWTNIIAISELTGEDGEDGTDGRGISSASINADGELVLVYTDGTSANLGIVVGSDGTNGKNGADGVSPTVAVSSITGGHKITITDKSGTKTVDVMGGSDGKDGADGRGITSVTRTSGTGAAGTTDTYTIKYSDNTTSTFTVYNGKNGTNGSNGTNGTNGTSVTVSKVTESTADGGSNIVTFSDGNTLTVKNGSKGSTGAKGDSGVYVGSGNIPDGYNVQIDPDGEAIEILTADETRGVVVDELAKRGQLAPEFANSIDECVDTSKLYVLPDGYIYAYMLTEKVEGGYTNLAEPLPDNTTDTEKWVNGYRFSSTAISAQSGTTVSNYISCKIGDVIRIKGVTLRENADRFGIYYTRNNEESKSIAYWNVTHNLFTCSLIDGVYTITLLEHDGTYNIHDLRFAMPTPADASAVIVTVNEEIVAETVVNGYSWANTNHAFVPNDYDDEFVALNEDIDSIKTDIVELEGASQILAESLESIETKIENIGTTEIPDYWESHIDSKISAIKNLHKQYGKDCFSFVFIADTHYPANLGKISPLLAKKIMDDANIKYAILAGDWQTRGCHKTKEALLEENEKIDAMFAPIRDRLLMQQGNHDGAYGLLDRDGDGAYINKDDSGNNLPVSDRETYVHNVTHGEMHEYAYRKVGMVGNVHFDDTGTAYYIDDISNNARYIGLNTQCNPYELQADGTQKYPKMWLMRFTQSQFDFLINEALVDNVNDKTKIVVFGHVPTTQEIGDRDVMNGVLKAFANRTTYSGSYAGEYGYDAVSVNADFTGAKGTLVGYFHGHIHSDSLNTTMGFPIIGTRCDAVEEYTEELQNERVVGTVTEQSFNVFTVTPDVIYSTKIGAGSDREISY